MTLGKYPKYKDSGVGWIGEIPEGWKARKLKNVLYINLGQSPEEELNIDEIGLPFYQGNADFGEKYPAPSTWCSKPKKIAERNDILVSVRAPVGELNLCQGKSGIGRGVAALGSQYYEFYYYVLMAVNQEMEKLSTGSTFDAIGYRELSQIKLPTPPTTVMSSISTFLDVETSKLQQLIDFKHHQIDLLHEHEKSLIHQAVTKGLDPKAKMKDSGVEWVGEIPAEWKTNHISREYEVQLGKMLQPESSPDALLKPYLRTANVFWNGFDLNDVNEMYISPQEKEQFSIVPGDLLVCEGGDVGRSVIWTGKISECYIQNSLHRIRPRGKNLNKFLYYCLFAANAKGEVEKVCSKATIAHYTLTKIKRTKVPLPSSAEQKSISSFLDSQTSKIHQAINNIENQIDQLEEYRKSLIYEVVTGKVKVS